MEKKDELNLNFEIGNKVYVPTPGHGFVEAKIVNILKSNNNKEITSISIKYVDDFIKETYGSDEVLYIDSNIQKILPKNKNINRPLIWMSQNRKEFPEWVSEKYMKYSNCKNSKNVNNNKTNGYKFSYHQKFIRDYLGHDSPYRGLLLYHGLGTGKTCAAIALSENLKDTRNIIIMLPKSIKHNFIEKGLKYCGDKEYITGNGDKLIENKYNFISYNSGTVIKQIEALGSLDNKVIIVDEAHNLATLMVNGLSGSGKQGYEIYKYLYEAKNSKIIFLTGTPLINTPFESAVLFNILRGPLEIIIFKINNFSENTIDDYISNLINDERIGWVDLNRKNQSLLVIFKLNSWDMEFEQSIRFVETQAQLYDTYVNYERTDSFSLFPSNEEEFMNFFIKDNKIINKNMFQRRIIGLTSFYEKDSKTLTDFPKQLSTEIVKIEMSQHQYYMYDKAREFEKKKERRAASEFKKKIKGDKISTLARVFSREFSNFVFPDEIIRPFQKIQFISELLEKKLKIEKNLNKMDNNIIEEKKINKNTLDKNIKEALVKLSDPSKPYLKQEKDGLSKYSPKMEAMLNEINKTNKNLILVYSAYRTVEGLEIFSLVLKNNGYEKYNTILKQDEKYDYKRYAFFSGQEDDDTRKKTIETYCNSENKYGKNIRVLLISAAGTEGLDLKNIRKVLIMEPYWHDVRLQQIIGRAVRKKSHIDLPENERNVKPIIYLSVLSKEQLEISKEKISTDEYIYNIAQKKLMINFDFLKAIQESAIDCMLNQCDNKKCYKFNGKGLAYLPQLSEDIVYGYNNIIEKEFKKNLIVAGITELNEIVYLKEKNWFYGNGKLYDGKPKTIKGKKYGIDLETFELFNYNSIKKGVPLLVGKINQVDSKFEEL